MKIRNDIRLGFILMVGDILMIITGFVVSYWLRFNSGLFTVVHGVPHINVYYRILPLLTVVFVFLLRSEKLYSARSRLSIVDEFFLIIRANTVAIVTFMAATFIYRDYSFSRGVLFISWPVLLLFICCWRFIVNRIRFSRRKRRAKTRNLVLIGDGPMIDRLTKHIADDPHWDYHITGRIEIRGTDDSCSCGIPVLGNVDNISKILDEGKIDEVIMTELDISRSSMTELILECEKRMVEFRLVADLLGMMTSQVDMRTIDGVPLLGLKESPLAEGYCRFIKRSMDTVLSLVGLVLLSPVFLLIALLVKKTSPGPVFICRRG